MGNIFRSSKNFIGNLWYQNRIKIIFSILGLLFVLVFLSPRIIYTVGPGQSGVLWLRFFGGTVVDKVYPEGIRFIYPWDKLYIYDVRIQEVKHDMDVLSKNGLTFNLSLSIRYRPEYDFIGLLHKRVGPDYLQKVIIPQVESVLRTTIGRYLPEEVYTTKRAVIQKYLLEASSQVSAKFIIIDEVIIRQIGLPPQIKEAIENKLKQQQLAQSYKFIIQKEKQEKIRKKIEAQGIQAFQRIVAETLTDRLLAWKGVEATLSLAQSDNTKVVVIGRGKDGLPIILDLRQDSTQSTIQDAGKGIGLVTDKQSTKQNKSSAQVTDQPVKQGENHDLATGQIANQIENVLTAAETKATTPLASMERYIKNFTTDEKTGKN
jgi:regulator of protease activity HflC (stomatin/prohibitin superfamily)